MRTALTALLSAVLASAVLAQEPPLPELADAVPLIHPRAPSALRGVSLCVTVGTEFGGDRALRTANYLTRLFERAGASVALDLGVSEDPGELARSAGAALLITVSGMEFPLQDLDRALEELRSTAVLQGPPAGGEVQDPPVLLVQVGPPSMIDDPALDLSAHREPAHRAFDAVVGWCGPQIDTLRARARASTRPDTRRGPSPLWPLDRAPATEAEVAALLSNWRARNVVDRSQVYLSIDVRKTEDGWEISGATELPQLEGAARRTLASVGVRPVTGHLRVLPDHDAIAGPAFGTVEGQPIVTWRIPGHSTGHLGVDPAGQIEETELRPGEPVRVLDRSDGFLLVHALSGYLGWVREAAIDRCDASAFRARLRAATLGDPQSRSLAGETAARHALAKLGTPYVFGGRSPTGIDCSGLVGTSWAAQGVFLPRDAKQQILAGALVATAQQPAPLEPGDLLFFADSTGRISHVGMSLGGHRFVHATPPEVTVASLDPSDPFYASVAQRFVLAKRVAR